jgi:hypothetical protein
MTDTQCAIVPSPANNPLNMTLLLRMVPLSSKMLILACFKGQLLKSGAGFGSPQEERHKKGAVARLSVMLG